MSLNASCACSLAVQRFARPLENIAWLRFLERCSHIRTYNDQFFSETDAPRLHYTAVWTLESQNPALSFPNLRELSITLPSDGLKFNCPTVTKLIMYMSPKDYIYDRLSKEKEMESLFHELPNIEELTLVGSSHLKHTACHLLDRCKSWPRLRSITIPSSSMSNANFTCLSRIPSLQAIHLAEFCPVLHCHKSAAIPMVLSALGPMPDLHAHAFPLLHTMALVAKLSGYVLPRLLTHRNFPGSKLKSLQIRLTTGTYIPSLKVRRLLECLRKTCMNLEELTLNIGPREHAGLMSVTAIEPLQYEDICSAFGFKDMKRLSIDHPAPIHLTPQQILYIAQASHNLESLWLNPEPAFPDIADYEIPLPMESLRAFAKYCTSIKRLALYLGGKPNFVAWNMFHDFESSRFTDLQELQVGESPVTLFPFSSRRQPTSRENEARQRCMHDWIAIATILAEVLSSKTTVITPLDSYLESCFRSSTNGMVPVVIWRDDATHPKADMRRSWHAIHALSLFLLRQSTEKR